MDSLVDTELAQLFLKWRQGHDGVWDKIFTVVYDELHRLAHHQLGQAWGVNTINTTALVHETYLKFIKQPDLKLEDRAHFFAISAKAMRQIVINYAQQKQAQKRGGDWQQVTMTASLEPESFDENNLLTVESALKVLAELDAELCQIVEMRFFGGMTEAEMATVIGVNERTVRRQWKKAKALLAQIIKEDCYDSKNSQATGQ